MKKSILLLIIVLVLSFPVAEAAESPFENYGVSSAGEHFYITYFPTDRSNTAKADFVHVNLFALQETEVRIYIPYLIGDPTNEIDTTFTVPANEQVVYSVPSSYVLPYAKPISHAPEPEKSYTGAALIVDASDPVYCTTLMEGQRRNEGYMAIPRQSLGLEYVVTSAPDIRNDDVMNYHTSYFSIVGVEDDTRVDIIIGGTTHTRTANGAEVGDEISVNLDKGDVYIVGSQNEFDDLSGTFIYADRPIAVYSGNTQAVIPDEAEQSQYIIEQLPPTSTFGTKYMCSIFAHENGPADAKITSGSEGAKLFKNGDSFGEFEGPGTVQGSSYKSETIDPEIKTVFYSSDKPILVSMIENQYKRAVPFQMNAIPQFQFMKSHILIYPEDDKLRYNFMSVFFYSPEGDRIPDDMMMGMYENGEITLKKLSEFDILGIYPTENDKYAVAHVNIQNKGVYKLISDEPCAAYVYGYGDRMSYGYTGETTFRNNYYTEDTLAPIVSADFEEFVLSGEVEDAPNGPRGTSGMKGSVVADYLTDNFTFLIDEMGYGSFSDIKWEAAVIDTNKRAELVVSFFDVSGNDTTVAFTYIPQDYAKAEFEAEEVIDLEERKWSYSGSVFDNPSDDPDVKTGISSIELIEEESENCTLEVAEFDPCGESSMDNIPVLVMVTDYKAEAYAKIKVVDCADNESMFEYTHIPDMMKPVCEYSYNAEEDYISGQFIEVGNDDDYEYNLIDSLTVYEETAENVEVHPFTGFRSGKYSTFDFGISQLDETKEAQVMIKVTDIFGNDSTFTFEFEAKNQSIYDSPQAPVIYPNPVDETLNVTFDKAPGACRLRISDIKGNVLVDKDIYIGKILTHDISGLTKGFYILEITFDGETKKAKFIKK